MDSGGSNNTLQRGLSAFGNGVLTYAGVGVFGGLFSLYGFSMGISGGSEFLGWPLMALGVAMIVLVFAELASAYPFAGSMYQWPTMLAGRRIGWGVGWLYLGAVVVLMTAYYASMPTIVCPLFGWKSDWNTDRDIILFTMLFSVVWNLLPLKALGGLAKYGMFFELTAITLILAIVFIIGPHHFGSLLDFSTVGATAKGAPVVQHVSSFGKWLPLLLGGGIFQAFWVLYTFENAGTLGEETQDASRNAPRAILGAFGFVVACGFLFLICLTTSVPNLHASMLAGTPAQDALGLHLPTWTQKLFLFGVSEGLLLATSTMFAGATRHVFGMSRDGQIPFSRQLSRTLKDGSPWIATLVLGGLSIIPVFVFGSNTAAIVGGATAAMYLAYFAVMSITLGARLKSWSVRGAFSLGRWGVPVNVLAVCASGAALVDLMWPRAATNPNYNQITGANAASVFSHIPMAWYIVGVPALIGVAYYAVFHAKIAEHELTIETQLGRHAGPPPVDATAGEAAGAAVRPGTLGTTVG